MAAIAGNEHSYSYGKGYAPHESYNRRMSQSYPHQQHQHHKHQYHQQQHQYDHPHQRSPPPAYAPHINYGPNGPSQSHMQCEDYSWAACHPPPQFSYAPVATPGRGPKSPHHMSSYNNMSGGHSQFTTPPNSRWAKPAPFTPDNCSPGGSSKRTQNQWRQGHSPYGENYGNAWDKPDSLNRKDKKPKGQEKRRLSRSKSAGDHEESPSIAIDGTFPIKCKRTFIEVDDNASCGLSDINIRTPCSYAGEINAPTPNSYTYTGEITPFYYTRKARTPRSPADYGTTFRFRDYDGTFGSYYDKNPFENPPDYVSSLGLSDYTTGASASGGYSSTPDGLSMRSPSNYDWGMRSASSRPRPQTVDENEEEEVINGSNNPLGIGMTSPPCDPVEDEWQLDRAHGTEQAKEASASGTGKVPAASSASNGLPGPPLVFKTAGQRRRYYRDLKVKRLQEEAEAAGIKLVKKKRRASATVPQTTDNGWDGVPAPPAGSNCRVGYDAGKNGKGSGYDSEAGKGAKGGKPDGKGHDGKNSKGSMYEANKGDGMFYDGRGMFDGMSSKGDMKGSSMMGSMGAYDYDAPSWYYDASPAETARLVLDVSDLSPQQIGELIGKNGCNAKEVRAKTGANVWVTCEENVGMRSVEVAAKSKEALDEAVRMVKRIVDALRSMHSI